MAAVSRSATSEFFYDSIGFFNKPTFSRLQKVAAAIALVFFSFATAFIFPAVQFFRHKRIVVEIEIQRNTYHLYHSSAVVGKGENSPDLKYTTFCYDLLSTHFASGFYEFTRGGFKSEQFERFYPRETPVIVPRLNFFGVNERYSEDDKKWVQWIIAYSGGIHRRNLASSYCHHKACLTQFKAYVELLMRLPERVKMVEEVCKIVIEATGGLRDGGVDDLRRYFYNTCQECIRHPSIKEFYALLDPELKDEIFRR